jgi:preprotein translocase subunit YajC
MQIDWNLLTLTPLLGQEGAPLPPSPGSAVVPPAAANGAGGALPVGGAGGAPGGGGGFNSSFIYLMLLMVVAMIFFSVMGQRRDRKKRQTLLASIKKHDRVQTVGGVIGSIVELKPDTVVLKVDESSNTRITFARSAISQVLNSGPDSGAPPAKE